MREVFHFCFLERLLALTSPDLYVLKGGFNLWFYFNSPRYSEDMDLDVLAGSVATLKKNGYKILGEASFLRSLRVYGIDGIESNDPDKAEHTEVTQRFRVGLITEAGQRLPTKVEFSRRATPSPASVVTERIDPQIARQYRKLSFAAQHYSAEAAALQKVTALNGRQSPQARDVFDLSVLYAGGHISAATIRAEFGDSQSSKACDAILSLDFDAFAGQVLEYLPEAQRKQYDSPAAWSALQEEVLSLFGV